MSKLSFALLGLALGAAAPVARAEVTFSGSGFLTVAVGKMLGGNRATVTDFACPCFISDYAQQGVYDGRSGLNWQPDTKLGLQGTATIEGTGLSFTGQLVPRAVQNGQPDLEWAYGSYQLSDDTSLHLGRKRLPIAYYSDVQDVGLALPWVHLPPQLYGWEAVNYNGVHLMHKANWGEWANTFGLLAGNESIRDSGYWRIYNGRQSRTNVKWSNIVGGEWTFTRDWFSGRASYIQSQTQRTAQTGVWDAATKAYLPSKDPFLQGQITQQRIFSGGFSIDYQDWLLHTELLQIDRPGATFADHAQLLATGKRWGAYQLMATVSRYYATAAAGGDPQGQEAHTSRALTLRYALSPTSALKAQFDRQNDQSGPNWINRMGDSRLLTLAYDQVF